MAEPLVLALSDSFYNLSVSHSGSLSVDFLAQGNPVTIGRTSCCQLSVRAVPQITGVVNIGTIVSPVSGTAPFNVTGFSHAGLNTPLGITIDPSGNVWIANNTTTAGVFEIVGAAAPTVTPIALALKNSAVGAKP